MTTSDLTEIVRGRFIYRLDKIVGKHVTISSGKISVECFWRGVDFLDFLEWIHRNKHILDCIVNEKTAVKILIQLYERPSRIDEFLRSYNRRFKISQTLQERYSKIMEFADQLLKMNAIDRPVKFKKRRTAVYWADDTNESYVVALRWKNVYIFEVPIHPIGGFYRRTAEAILSLLSPSFKRRGYQRYSGIYIKAKSYNKEHLQRVVFKVYQKLKDVDFVEPELKKKLLTVCFGG